MNGNSGLSIIFFFFLLINSLSLNILFKSKELIKLLSYIVFPNNIIIDIFPIFLIVLELPFIRRLILAPILLSFFFTFPY